MIYTVRKVTVKNGASTIDAPVILYRGDKQVAIKFTIIDGQYKFKTNGNNMIDNSKAAYGQLAIQNPDGNDTFTDIAACEDGQVVFHITGEMIDELHEVGMYSFHIRLFDEDQTSRITIPHVQNGIVIKEPIVIEDDVNSIDTVGDATVGYSMIQTIGDDEEVFDENGNYIPTTWSVGDKITAEKLNKMEEGISKPVSSGNVDLTGYAKTSDIPTKTSQLQNDSDFATNASVDKKIANASTISPEMTTFIVEKEYTQPGETTYTDLGIEISNEFTTYARDDDGALIIEKVTYTEAASIYIDTTVNKKFRVTQTNANRWRVLYFTETFENIVDGQQPYSYTMSDDSIPSSNIITANSNINCIVIGIGWEAINPTITVEKITETVETSTVLFLDDNIKIDSSNVVGDNTGSSSTQNKYIVLGNPGIYKSTENTVVPSTATQSSEIYSNYNSLMSSYPNYITRQELGVDDFGNSIYCYTFKKKRPTILSSISSDNETVSATWDSNYQPTFLLTSGVHGDERGSVVVLYEYLKKLCESTDVEELEFVKNNAVLMVIPLVNPSGYNANTRYNGNRVDLNRAFYTGSEAENQIIRTFIQANIEEIDYVYDCHNTANKASIWSVPNRFAECLFLSMAIQLVPYWKTLNESLTDPFVFYKLMADVGGLDEWVNKLGVPAITLEISYHTDGLLGITTTSKFDAFSVQVGIDILGNAIIGGIKYLS